jgi:RHS repeat-associated protein
MVVAAALLSLLLGIALTQALARGGGSSVRVAMRSRDVAHKGLSSLPLMAQGQISATLGAEDDAFRVSAAAGGFRAVNPAQHLGVRFGRSGVTVVSGRMWLGLSLRGVGYGASLTGRGAVAPRVRANRVVYGRAGVSEWYANGPLGLEQGFTVTRAPSGDPVGPLTLSMALSGNVRASVAADGQSLTISHAGGPSLRYGGLVASDARGRSLHSWLQFRAGQVLLRVDTRGARFPLRIDPLVHQAQLDGGEEIGGGEFGYSVALSANGNTAMVGGPGNNSGVGAVWVFVRSGSTWTQQAEITGKAAKESFGFRLALSSDGNTAVIAGDADWIYTRSEGKWAQQAELKGEEGCGDNLAISGDGHTVLTGYPAFKGSVGTACVFTYSEGKWSQQGPMLTGGEEVGDGEFGASVALSYEGNTALIGGPADNREGHPVSVGAAWVFTRSEGIWSQQGEKITTSGEINKESFPEATFGDSVALSSNGNTALIGDNGDDGYVGAAWIFTRSGEEWRQQQKITASGEYGSSEKRGKGLFGTRVTLSAEGNTALVGAPAVEWAGYENGGAAYVFARSGSTWSQQGPKIVGGEYGRITGFGESLALSSNGSTALVGAFEIKKPTKDVGAAFVFTQGFAPEELYGLENEAEPNHFQTCVGDPVNCATGNQVETQSDLTIGGRGPGLHLTRTYNSQLAVAQAERGEHGSFGYGWTGPYSAHLVVNEAAETATVYQANGSTVPFVMTTSKTYAGAVPAVEATLVKEGSTYVYTLPNQTKLTFSGTGQLTSETDRDGNAITMTYNVGGQLESVADAAGRKIIFSYNGEGFVENVKDPMGHVVKYTYESGNLVSVTQPGEASLRWQFKYNAEHEMTSETDGRSHAVTTEYDSSHRAISQTDALGRKRKWEYGTTEWGEAQTTITEPTGAITVEQFNSALLPTSITRAYGTALAATTTYGYNEANELITVNDPNKHTTTYGYDAAGDRTSAKDANENETKWTYDNTHDVETMTTPKGETTTYKRESHGNPEVIERPAPGSKIQKTTYKYDSKGDVTSETNPLEHTRTYEYDTYGDRESETDPEGNKRTWKYNEDSQEIATVSPRGNVKGAEISKYETKTERDAQGRPIKVTDPLGHTTKYTYDGDGNLETLTDGNSHKTTYTYDSDNEQTKIEKPNGQIMETGYDGAGQITSQTDGNKHTIRYERNLLEEVTEEVNPLGRKTTKEYDPAGNLTKLTDHEKRTTTYMYDPGNRLKEVVYSSGKPATIKYEYDKDGDRTQMTDGTGVTKYTYDQLDRLTETENGHKEKVKYEYDLANDQIKITYPNTKAVTRTFDKDDRIEKITDWSSRATKFSYDPDSDLTTTAFPSETKDKDKYTYNEADQLSEVKMTKEAETLASLLYIRDNDGQVKTVTSKGLPGEEKPGYEYDSNNRLTKGGTISYEYDAANNPTKIGSGTYKYDNANELETGPSLKYTYNEMDQRTKTTPTTGPATTYGYDQAGNLTSVERPKEGETTEIKDTYAYDGNNLRASQTISGTTTYLAWDVSETLPLLLSDGTNSYIYGPGGLPFEQINNSTGTVLYLHHDQQGSTRMLTGSTGKSEATMTYDAYGNTTGTTGTAKTPLGYDAQYTSTDTGLIYLRARVYDPSTAQFLTVDPLNKMTREPYAYANDNPVNESDPAGLFSFGEIVSGIATVVTVGVCLTPGVDAFACGPAIGINVGIQSGLVLASSRSVGEKAGLVLANGVLGAGSVAFSSAAELAAEEGAPGGILNYLRAAGALVPSLPGFLEPEPKTGTECG